MIIRATESELEVSGTADELHEIARTLSNMGLGEHARFTADTDVAIAPYDRALAVFEVIASNGLVLVSATEDTLRASGHPEMLKKFASFFEFPSAAPSGTHTHHEWWEGNESIAPDSRPLVISVQNA